MKRKLTIFILAVTLSGCTSEVSNLTRPDPAEMEPMPPVTEAPAVPQTNQSLEIWYNGQDYGSEVDVLRDAEADFQKRYPDVDLTVRRTRNDTPNGSTEHYDRLATEVMSGKGPDLFWMDSYQMDWYKMMRAGVFANLNAFMENDPDFHKEDYNQAVLEGGRFRGCQYLLPTHYTIPVLLSEKSLLEEQGLDPSGWTDYLTMWEAIAEYSQRQRADPSLPYPVHLYSYQLSGAFPWTTGIRWINLDNGTLDLNQPELAQALACHGELSNRMTFSEEILLENSNFDGAKRLLAREELFEAYVGWGSFSSAVSNAAAMASEREPVLVPIYDVNGGIQAEIRQVLAVRRNSPNQENAWNFIRMLLEPRYQTMTNSGIWLFEIPLSYEALDTALEEYGRGLDPNMRYMIPGLDNLQIVGLPQSFRDAYRAAVNKVSGAYYHNQELEISFNGGFYAFMLGENTFEECIPDAEEVVEFYLSE